MVVDDGVRVVRRSWWRVGGLGRMGSGGSKRRSTIKSGNHFSRPGLQDLSNLLVWIGLIGKP